MWYTDLAADQHPGQVGWFRHESSQADPGSELASAHYQHINRVADTTIPTHSNEESALVTVYS